MERTDKIVATALQISRKDALTLIKKGRISANGKVIKDAKTKLDENSAELFFDDNRSCWHIIFHFNFLDFPGIFNRKRLLIFCPMI